MLLPKSFLDDLRQRVRLSDVIGKRIKLTRAGHEFKACCPFHNEKSPSFYINEQKGFYHCFGCGAHGDAFSFLTRHQNMSFMDAVEEVAGMAGMQVPKPSAQDVEKERSRSRLISLMEAATKWYAQQLALPANRDILDYLTQRGLKPETIEAFRLGYAPPESAQLVNAMKQAGYTVPEMIEAGILKASQRDGGAPYAFFRDRVMFPVTDKRGQTIAFGARVLPEHIRPLKQGESKPPKYINSGETVLFHKGHVLYNESRARTAAGKGDPVIVCEGYADVIALWQAGFAGAVAPLGTALTEAQIGSLWAMAQEDPKTGLREPVLCFDGDAAGQRAATRALERILPQLQAGRSARFAFLPDGMDPDDLIKAKGPESFHGVLATSIPMVDMIWRTLTFGRRFDTPEGKAGLQKAIRETCAKIADLSVQKAYMGDLREKTFKALSGMGNRKKGDSALSTVRLPDPKSNGRNTRARVALAAILCFPEIFQQAEEILGRLHIEDPRLDSMRQSILAALSETPDMDHEGLLNLMTQKGFSEDLQGIMAAARLHGTMAAQGANAQSALAGFREAVGGA